MTFLAPSPQSTVRKKADDVRDRHVNAGPALGVGQLDGLRHGVWIFAAVIQRLEPKAGAVHTRVLRTFFARHLRKSMGELPGRPACKRARMGPAHLTPPNRSSKIVMISM